MSHRRDNALTQNLEKNQSSRMLARLFANHMQAQCTYITLYSISHVLRDTSTLLQTSRTSDAMSEQLLSATPSHGLLIPKAFFFFKESSSLTKTTAVLQGWALWLARKGGTGC